MKYYLNNSYEFLTGDTDCADNALCPQKLHLDITQDCNLYCKMCRSERCVSGKTMPMELFQRVVEETAPYVRSYSLFNWGEPLMVKDFRDRVLFVNQHKRSDCVVEISTNGMLLSDEMTDFLYQENVSIIISVDSADKKTFEGIRRGSDFERIMCNAKNAAAKYCDFPIQYAPEFYISIQKENQNQILDIVKLAHSLGIRRIGCGLVTAPERYAPKQDEKLCRELEQAYLYIKQNGMFIDVLPTKVGNYVLSGEKYCDASDFIVSTVCNAPFVSATIEYSGDVYLCCNIGERVGTVSEGSFLELWKSQRYNMFRSVVNEWGRMPKICESCAWFNRN